MSQRRGVCVVRFDDKMGPGCIYHLGLDNQFAQKVCVKSHISTLSLSSSSDIKENFVDSVIPFLDEGYIAYSNFFFVKDSSARGGKRTLGIVTLVDRSEQMSLYKSIPEISATVREIASDLALQNINDMTLTDQVKSKLNQLLHLESLSVDFESNNDSVRLIKERIEKEQEQLSQVAVEPLDNIITEGSFEFLLTRIQDGLDRVIHALLKNERILVFGEEQEISLTLATLRWFLPHKKLYNDLWTVPLVDAEALFSRSSDSTHLHILGIHSDSFYEILQMDNNQSKDMLSVDSVNKQLAARSDLPIETKILINLDGGRVIGGITNRFCTSILEAIKGQDYNNILTTISDHIDYLLERVFDLIFLILEDVERDQLQQFISDSIEGEISLIVTIISETNPAVMQKILDTFSKYELPLDVIF